MCAYCYMGDHHFRWDPPFTPDRDRYPTIPESIGPVVPWSIERLLEFEDLMKRVKKLEEAIGCPSEPNKADYLAVLREQIEKLEQQVKKP